MDIKRVFASMRRKAREGRPATQMRGTGGGPRTEPVPREGLEGGHPPGEAPPEPSPPQEVIVRPEDDDLPVVGLMPPSSRYFQQPQGEVHEGEEGE